MSYTITKVRKDDRGVITECWIAEMNFSLYKSTIVDSIKKGIEYYAQDVWGNRSLVRIVLGEHLSTNPDGLTSNNLDNLPTY